MLFKPVASHRIERQRQEPKRRLLTVDSVTRLTPRMLRIAFASPELADFSSRAPDDHIKLFLPDPANPGQQVMRDYTPRAFDAARKILTIDFAVHEAGPATAWALAAKPGDKLAIGGPKGSAIVADDFDYYLLIGDESALPAIGRRVEGLRSGVPVATIVVVDGPEEAQRLRDRGRLGSDLGFSTGRTRRRRHPAAEGAHALAGAERRRLCLDRGGGSRRQEPARHHARRARPSESLAQGLGLLAARSGRRDRETGSLTRMTGMPRAFALAAALNLGFVALEITTSQWANSTALLAAPPSRSRRSAARAKKSILIAMRHSKHRTPQAFEALAASCSSLFDDQAVRPTAASA